MDIAIATIKIHARLVHPDHPARTVPTVNPAPMDRKVHPARPALFLIGSTQKQPAVASNARQDPRDRTAELAQLDLLDPKAAQAERDPTATPAAQAQPAQLAHPAQAAPPAHQDPKENPAHPERLERRDHPAQLDKREAPAPLAAPAQPAVLDTQDPPAQLAHPAHPVDLAMVPRKDQTAHPDRKAHPAQTPSTAHAQDVRPRPRPRCKDNSAWTVDFIGMDILLLSLSFKRSHN